MTHRISARARRATGTVAALALAAGFSFTATAPATAKPSPDQTRPAQAQGPKASSHAKKTTDAVAATPLPLGPASLTETRTVETVQPGVTHTTIVRGSNDGSLRWVIEINIPSTATSPDPAAPARSVQDQASAEATAAKLDALGYAATASPVLQHGAVDIADGVIGYRVRLDATFATKAEADAAFAQLKAAGFAGRPWYQGWDGDNASNGPWTVHVLTIDPKTFRGELLGTYGPTLEKREKTTELAAFTGANAAINAGFFVMDPKAGAEGDPAGAGVYGGVFASETIDGRPALALDTRAKHTAIVRPTWKGTLRVGSNVEQLDGWNRVPGLIRNCGGDATDSPTELAVHDFTCTDASELVAFTPAWGPTTPVGAGTEVVLDAHGRVLAVNATRGTALAAGQQSVQGTGAFAAKLANLKLGQQVKLTGTLDAAGRTLTNPKSTVINGGPLLMADGDLHVTQDRDGMHQAASNPSFDYGWVLQRNPRTFAGIDAQGRTLLVTVDGRQVGDLGLSIPETAAVAQALGMVDAINLDGGGSTAMVLDGALITRPSDATGERPVGDAIVIR